MITIRLKRRGGDGGRKTTERRGRGYDTMPLSVIEIHNTSPLPAHAAEKHKYTNTNNKDIKNTKLEGRITLQYFWYLLKDAFSICENS